MNFFGPFISAQHSPHLVGKLKKECVGKEEPGRRKGRMSRDTPPGCNFPKGIESGHAVRLPCGSMARMVAAGLDIARSARSKATPFSPRHDYPKGRWVPCDGSVYASGNHFLSSENTRSGWRLYPFAMPTRKRELGDGSDSLFTGKDHAKLRCFATLPSRGFPSCEDSTAKPGVGATGKPFPQQLSQRWASGFRLWPLLGNADGSWEQCPISALIDPFAPFSAIIAP